METWTTFEPALDDASDINEIHAGPTFYPVGTVFDSKDRFVQHEVYELVSVRRRVPRSDIDWLSLDAFQIWNLLSAHMNGHVQICKTLWKAISCAQNLPKN